MFRAANTRQDGGLRRAAMEYLSSSSQSSLSIMQIILYFSKLAYFSSERCEVN